MGELGRIPSLYQKFRLLISLGFYKDWESLGEAFGVRPGTVKSWANGSKTQMQDRVPAKHQLRLIAIFETIFAKKNYSRATVQSLIYGNLHDLEEELRTYNTFPLPALIDMEGANDRCKLFFKPTLRGLVETDEPPKPAIQFSVPIGVFFRLEFDTDFSGSHLYALQHISHKWSPLSVSLVPNSRTIHVPGFGRAGKPLFMAEKTQAGHHRFVVLQTKNLFPHSGQNALRQQSILDVRTLTDLATFYNDQKAEERRIFYVDIEIKPEQHASP